MEKITKTEGIGGKEMKGNEKVNYILDKSSASLVATILPNLEVLQKNNTFKLELIRDLIRETIYSHYKFLAKLLSGVIVNFEERRK